MILGVGGLAVYPNGGNSHFSCHPQSLLIMREEGVITVNGLKVEKRLKATGLDERSRSRGPQ